MKKVIDLIRVRFPLTKKALIPEKWDFLCTVSCGQDSTFAFLLLLHLDLKNSLQILYCNHFWQLKNFLTIRELYQLSYFTNVSYNVILPAKAVLTENQAREWRKKMFWRFSQFQQSTSIITGHTETDILEKNLNNICRGTSLRSFSTVKLSTSEKRLNIAFFRPSTSLELTQLDFCILNNQTKQFKSQSSQAKIRFFLPHNFLKLRKRGFFNKKKFHFSNKKKITNTFFITKINFWLYFSTESLTNLLSFSYLKSFSYLFCFSNESHSLAQNIRTPLDKIKRVTISKVIKLYSLPLIVDLTNFSSTFSRNKIRHQLIPLSQFLFFRNTESLLINFFQTVEFSITDQEQKWQEFYFVSGFLLITPTKQNKVVSLLKKNLGIKVFRNKTQYLIQKLFFDSKHVTLTFSQLINITKFFIA